ncbi:hypothetical protein JCM10908_002569 [Rhodotorula pacifica]|uniref:uncharacterized protein n=1 Tax=Rhodotorula pacifica TaxID=1495444 RepID=UPI00317AE0C3
MQDSRLRLEKLYSCKVRPVEERRKQLVEDANDASDSQAIRSLSVDDAFPSRKFKNSTNTLEDVRAWKDKLPALRTRAFFVVQNHYATAKHYDLRLQLDGAMFSWAIPRGFDPPYEGVRLAIETFPHGISYALYEGLATHGNSHAGIWDVGEYEVRIEIMYVWPLALRLNSSEQVDEYQRRGDLDNEETVPASYDESAPAHDLDQEARLREALRYCHFADVGTGKRGAQTASRSFRLLLKGTRFQDLRLVFSRRITDVKHVTPKDTRLPTTNRQWTVVVLSPRQKTAAAAARATTSILSNRTMYEINKQSRAALLLNPNMVEQQERDWSVETGESLSYPDPQGEGGTRVKEEALECEEASLVMLEVETIETP